ITAAAYYSIPIALVWFAMRRRDVAFNWMYLLFGAFILLCETTHVFDILAVWQPVYRLDGVIEAATGIGRLGTGIARGPRRPRALALPSPETGRVTNAALQAGTVERRAAEAGLRRAREEREARVEARTSELAEANRSLRVDS